MTGADWFFSNFAQDSVFTDDELCLLLDAVMVLYREVEAVPANDGINLLEIGALQHKIEGLLSKEVTGS